MADFKKPTKKRNFRKTRKSFDSDDDSDKEDETRSTIDGLKEFQKLRKRAHGVTAEDLNAAKIEKKEQKDSTDPFKMKTGGFIDMKNMKREQMRQISEEDMEDIGTSFAAETNRRDEDADMLKYVEEQLAKKKGTLEEKDSPDKKSGKADDFLYELPEHIRALDNRKRTEDMLSNQMLSGIPEIDLGIEAKIKNIEQTEDAKAKLVQEKMRKKDKGISEFVPTNYAVNFVQHNRFNIEDSSSDLKKRLKRQQQEKPKPEPLRVGDAERPATGGPGGSLVTPKPSGSGMGQEKATDDFHYEKFKKQMRRY